MENITIYRTVKNPKTAVIIMYSTFIIIISMVILSILGIVDFFSFGFRLFFWYSLLLALINFFYPLYAHNIKYVIDETNNTLCIKGGWASRKTIQINQIYQIDIYRSKKGRIKYFLLRTPPSAFISVIPYLKEPFLSHLKKLNPQIVVKDLSLPIKNPPHRI